MLYHEKQVAALCGVHCLNTLLQGPYFSEIELAQIAQGLDELERALVGEGALGEGSGNVALDGMFSIQVLSRALESWGLQVVSLESEEAREFKAAPTTAAAFICNLHEHWFTLRRVAHGEWWNFNSLYPAPQPLSTFYLQAFLDTLRGEGWTIFVVTGPLPAAQPGSLDQLPNATGRWWSPDEARAATDEAERARKRGRLANALEEALERAAQQGGQLQLRTRGGGGVPGSATLGEEDEDEDADLAAAIAASLQSQQPSQQAHLEHQPEEGGQGGSHAWPGHGGGGGGGGQGPYEGIYGDEYEDDPELAMAIAASLAEAGQTGGEQPPPVPGQQQAPTPQEEEEDPLEPEPEAEGEGVIEVAFRLPTGTRCSRRFTLTSPSSALFTYVGPLLCLPAARIALSTAFPKKELERSRTTTLGDLGLTHRTMLVAEPKR
ncbi:hypothetical protein Vretimale_6219 [Volvox reticuliferus]|uniref:ubiquitinyl hydrolase 1 n=1 Tax=Volvox reticuliferus TaxID=1737510 RepID=A0A8J4LM01_9CHLO|nr:hypothetical protein Vretifemale_8028 [Volvox reticuliferus]GIM01395.1 hypothetical protein Vretimale_6219 [Volvox reticuliferus]